MVWLAYTRVWNKSLKQSLKRGTEQNVKSNSCVMLLVCREQIWPRTSYAIPNVSVFSSRTLPNLIFQILQQIVWTIDDTLYTMCLYTSIHAKYPNMYILSIEDFVYSTRSGVKIPIPTDAFFSTKMLVSLDTRDWFSGIPRLVFLDSRDWFSGTPAIGFSETRDRSRDWFSGTLAIGFLGLQRTTTAIVSALVISKTNLTRS